MNRPPFAALEMRLRLVGDLDVVLVSRSGTSELGVGYSAVPDVVRMQVGRGCGHGKAGPGSGLR